MRAAPIVALAMLLAAPASALTIPPRPAHGLADPGNVLTPAEQQTIEARLEGYAQGTTARYAVAIFPSLEDENTQDFGIRIFEAWKLGGKDTNDGVLITIYDREHKIRIDTGYGNEGKLPDILCKQIIDTQMAPRFRAGDKVGGILAALAAIDHEVTGRSAAPPPYQRPVRGNQQAPHPLFILFVIVVLVVMSVWSARRGRRGGAWFFPWWWGGGGGGGFGGGGGGFGGGGWGGGGGGSAGGGGADGGW